MNKKLNIVVGILLGVLVGCSSTEDVPAVASNNSPSSLTVYDSPIPVVSDPPDVMTYLGSDDILDRHEVRLYYNALRSYRIYIQSYMDFLGTQYNIKKYNRDAACREATSSFRKTKTLPKTPSIRNLSDEQVVDTLTNHIAVLRAMVREYNNDILSRREKVLNNCHSVIFYPNS